MTAIGRQILDMPENDRLCPHCGVGLTLQSGCGECVVPICESCSVAFPVGSAGETKTIYAESRSLRINDLAREITMHDQQYWEHHDPLISDAEYDELVRQLAELDPQHSLVTKIHPVRTGGTFKFENPMLSLDKAYTAEEVLKWAKSVARGPDEIFVVAPKFDGCACEVGPDYVATRGDGETGELVSDKRAIIDLSHRGKQEQPERGELVVFKEVLPTLQKQGGSVYKTCRSAAAGLLGLKTVDVGLGRVLKFMPYTLSIGQVPLSELGSLDWPATLQAETEQDYPIDGLVISLFDTEYGESLGYTSHHPRHSIAFKIANPTTVSKLLGVEWQVSKTRIAPVAILEPTELDGVTISRATLHNLQEIARLGVGIGSKVQLVRAGSVIPAITSALSKGTADIQVPTQCPACGSDLDNDGQDLRCTFQGCGGTAACRLRDALVRLEIEECGPAVCSALVERGIDMASKVLQMQVQDWAGMPGFATRSAEKMRTRMIWRLETPIDDYRILAAQNFEGIGLTLSRRIMDKFSVQELPTADLCQVEGVGETRAAEIKLDQEWYDLLMLLQVRSTKGSLSRPTVCFTGKSTAPREEWIKLAEERGYNFSKSVTKTLSLLVLADLESNSNKAKKAREYGIKTMTYEEFKDAANPTENV